MSKLKEVGLTRVCKVCKIEKPISHFFRHRKGALHHRHTCKQCKSLKGNIASYGISEDQFYLLLKEQCGVCAICGEPEPTQKNYRLSIDHCHATGKIRGLLCSRCNSGIARFQDSPTILAAAIDYLQRQPQGVLATLAPAPAAKSKVKRKKLPKNVG